MNAVRSCLVFAPLAALCAAPAAQAQISRCLDAGGRVVAYATECPAGTRASATGIRNEPSSSATPPGRTLAEQEADFRKRRAESQAAKEKTEKAETDAANRSDACTRARAYLKALESGQRVARTDPTTGERRFLEDTEYANEIAVARRAAESNCR